MAAEDVPAKAAHGTVKIAGQKMSKKTLGIAALIGVGVIGYAYMRRNKAAAGAATDPNAAGSIDPVTGYPYGSPQDTAALAASQGPGSLSGGIDPQTGLPFGTIQDEQALQDAGFGVGAGGGGTTGTANPPAPSVTIAEWEQECISNLEAGGVAGATITSAESGLPRYLAHLSLSPAQATAVQLAVGLTGPPPGGGTYSIIPAAPAPAPPPGKTPPPVVTPPHIISKHTISADGTDDLNQIAVENHVTEAQLVAVNPALKAKYWGTGVHVPKGTHVVIPAHP